MYQKKYIIIKSIIIIIFLSILFTGCNIFSWMYNGKDRDFEDYLLAGEIALMHGDYDTALIKFNRAVELNSASGRARLGLGKTITARNITCILYVSQIFFENSINKSNVLNTSDISGLFSRDENLFDDLINALSPIVNGGTIDHDYVSCDDAGVNLNLSLAYLMKAFPIFLDTDKNDNVIGSSTDFVFISSNNELKINEAILNIDEITSGITYAATNDPDSGISTTSNDNKLLMAYGSCTNYEPLTNLSGGSIDSSLDQYLKSIHHSTENSLMLLFLASETSGFLDGAYECMERIMQSLNNNETAVKQQIKYFSIPMDLDKLNVQLNKLTVKINSYRTDVLPNVEIFATSFNNLHFSITGQYSYDPIIETISDYSYTAYINSIIDSLSYIAVNSNNMTSSDSLNLYTNMQNAYSSESNANSMSNIQSWLPWL